MATHRLLIVEKTKAEALNTWLKNHPLVDPRGGGDKTFTMTLALLTDPPDGSVVRAYIAGWKLPNGWWLAIRDEVLSRGWHINDPAFDEVAHYRSWLNDDTGDQYTREEALADTTKKSQPLRIVPVPA
ncbi:MAG: hypothetical protein ACYSYU_07915 [Planctomycetota bacterium]|jgi:hypothetical protein